MTKRIRIHLTVGIVVLALCLAWAGPVRAYDLMFSNHTGTYYGFYLVDNPDSDTVVYTGCYGDEIYINGWAHLLVDKKGCSATLMQSPEGMSVVNVTHLFTENTTPTTQFRGRRVGRWYCDAALPDSYYHLEYFTMILGQVGSCWKTTGSGP